MTDKNKFYSDNIKQYATEVSSLKKRLIILSTVRLVVFILSAIGLYLLYPYWKLMLLIGLLGVGVFILLLSRYTDFKSKLELNQSLLKINEEEQKIASGNFEHRYSGDIYQNANHHYSFDVDLFGKGSFFQYINRTVLSSGQDYLAQMLNANAITDIEMRQEAIQELSQKQKWSQLFTATGSLIKTESSSEEILHWLKHHNPFVPQYINWLPWGFSTVSIVLLFLSIFEIIDVSVFGYWLFVGLALTGAYLKKINVLAHNSDKAKATFKQFSSLLLLIEQQTFSSELLKDKQQQIHLQDIKASSIVKTFSKHLDALDNRNNLIGAIFGNGYLLLDLKNAYKIEKWIQTYGNKVEDWFEIISFFDAYNTLGTFSFNHPDHTFPKINFETSVVINAKDLGHPMIKKSKRIPSEVIIGKQQFFIVTGANMAGKSTFLRTVSLHIIMANMGLPVCASSSLYTPVKLITSMRTSDSLSDESSYFFSELTRLKFIVESISKEPYFIVLDEILKGTNSTDKAIGSKKFVEKLVAGNATGIIATHDLSLCEISETLDGVENYFFDAEIIDDELHFGYKLKKGICQNMNASFLLKKMDIV